MLPKRAFLQKAFKANAPLLQIQMAHSAGWPPWSHSKHQGVEVGENGRRAALVSVLGFNISHSFSRISSLT